MNDATASVWRETLIAALGLVGLSCVIGFFAHSCVAEEELTLRKCLGEHTVSECKLMELRR